MRPATTAKFCTTRESLTAHRHSSWTTRVEAAATRGMNETGNLTSSREIGNTLVAIGTEVDTIKQG